MNWWPFRRSRTDAAVEPENIRGFNAMTVHLLGKLYGTFPEPLDIDPLHEIVSIAFDIAHRDLAPPETERYFARYFVDTLNWLEVEGFVRVRNRLLDGKVQGVVLTEKALRAMGRVPSSIKAPGPEKRSLGELMREASVKQGVALPGELVKALLTSTIA
jgi:hypothetical protein